MAKKRTNKAGHVFGGHIGGIDYFRQDDGKWTDSGGTLVEPGYAKVLDQFFPQEVEDENTPPPKKKRKRKPIIEPDEEEKPKKKRGRKPTSKSDEDEEEDKSSLTSRLGKAALKSIFPQTYGNVNALREIISGKKDKDEENKEKSQKKRDDDNKRREYENVEDKLGESSGLLRDILAVQQRSATLLSKIAETIGNLKGGGLNLPNLGLPNKGGALKNLGRGALSIATSPITAAVGVGAVGAYGAYKAGQSLSEYAAIPNREDKNQLDASSIKPDGTAMTDAEMREQAFKQRGNRMAGRPANTAPVAAPIAPEVKPVAKDIATSKETTAVAEAKQKQVKTENILTFKADEIKFNADRLTFEVQTLTIENKGQPANGASQSGTDEGSSGGANTPKSSGGGGTGSAKGATPGGGEGATTPGEVKGAPITGGKGKETTPTPTLTEEQKKDFAALSGEGIKGDDPRAKQYQNLTDEQLKAAGIEKTPEGGFKQSTTSASKMTDEEVAAKVGTGKYRPEYKLTDADLSDDVLNTIAGEARMKDPTSVDAVINNMFNRLGAKGYGPSANLQQVARAPGQYEGYRKATEKEKEMLRERIKAVASGEVEDITKGADQYRATSYVKGQGAGKTFSNLAAEQGNLDLGGNTYARTKNAKNGPYAAYATTGQEPPPQGPITPEVIAKKREQLQQQEQSQRQTSLAATLTKQKPAMAYTPQQQSATSPALSAIEKISPSQSVDDKKVIKPAGRGTVVEGLNERANYQKEPDATKLPGGDEGLKDRDIRSANMQHLSNLTEKEPILEPDATKLPGGDEGLKDREVRSANMQHLSNMAEKETAPQNNARLESGRDGDTSGDEDWNKNATQIDAPPAKPAPPPPPLPQRRPADISSTPPQTGGDNRPSSTEYHSPKPGGNGAQFLEAVFRIMPYLLHQKKHAPQVGRRWHY